MPRIQIYLPDDLYAEVKTRKLRASELAQHALRAEIRRQELIEAARAWLAEQNAEHGEPSEEDLIWAVEVVARLKAKLRPDVEHEASADGTRKAS